MTTVRKLTALTLMTLGLLVIGRSLHACYSGGYGWLAAFQACLAGSLICLLGVVKWRLLTKQGGP